MQVSFETRMLKPNESLSTQIYLFFRQSGKENVYKQFGSQNSHMREQSQ